MANLTITVDPNVLKKARLRALEENTSVNAILRERLAEYADQMNKFEEATRQLLELARHSKASRGNKKWKRDDLYDR